jgi:hypothetical protein
VARPSPNVSAGGDDGRHAEKEKSDKHGRHRVTRTLCQPASLLVGQLPEPVAEPLQASLDGLEFFEDGHGLFPVEGRRCGDSMAIERRRISKLVQVHADQASERVFG